MATLQLQELPAPIITMYALEDAHLAQLARIDDEMTAIALAPEPLVKKSITTQRRRYYATQRRWNALIEQKALVEKLLQEVRVARSQIIFLSTRGDV